MAVDAIELGRWSNLGNGIAWEVAMMPCQIADDNKALLARLPMRSIELASLKLEAVARLLEGWGRIHRTACFTQQHTATMILVIMAEN
jgi:hypothetical protein